MLSKDFYGKKGFIWWIGVVEDIDDPLQLGGARVRIIGVHSDDMSLVPTETLPWAQQLRPSTGSVTYSSLKVADWVFGFFQDGEYAQIPVIMGVFSGIEGEQAKTLYQTWTVKQGGVVPQQPDYSSSIDSAFYADEYGAGGEDIKLTTNETSVVGQPAVSPAFRSKKPKVMAANDAKRRHVCDITPEVQKSVGWIKAQFGPVVEAIRVAIRGVLAALGLDPSGVSSYFKQIAEEVVTLLRKITKAIKEINDYVTLLVKVATLLRAVIDYILSLPDRARKFLQECVDKFLKALAAGFEDLFIKPITGITSGALKDIKKQFDDISRAAQGLVNQTARLIAAPARVVEALITPSNSTDLAAVERQMKGYVNKVTTTGTTLYNQRSIGMSANNVGTVI